MQRKRGNCIEKASVQHYCFVFLCCCYLECWYPFKRQGEGDRRKDRERAAGFLGHRSICISFSATRGSSGMWATLPGFVILQGPLWAEQYWSTFESRGTLLWVTGPQQKPRKGTVSSLFPPILVNSGSVPLLLLISCFADCPIQVCVDYLFLQAFPSFLTLGTVCG